MSSMKRLFLPLVLFLAASDSRAQAPHEEWRTITTDSFRVHYAEPWEEWALRAASRLESTRERVAAAVGYNPDDRIEVVVMDPAATANAMALPLLRSPRIILWTTPPEPLSAIGDSRDWQELLLVHETAHILHLNRPSRDPLDHVLERFIPIGPVARAPRWVSEGYATVVEGDLTGSGRPFRDFRAAVLRTWAIEGKLPSYAQMAGDSRSFMGMAMAYLAGSAYLEWLRERTSPDSLVHLWRRMSARQDRTFDEAFAGVFGDSPQELYALFRAELIQKARNLGDAMAPSIRDGELVIDLSRRVGPLVASEDGNYIAAVVRPREEPVSIVIWETAPNTEAIEKREEQLQRMIERDPEDVRPVDPPAAPRKRAHTLTLPRGADVESMTFVGEALRLAFTSNHPDDDATLHSELHVWDPATGEVERITRRGDVFAISSTGGAEIVAVRHRHGKSGLVRIDLATGTESPLVAPRLEPLVIDVAAARGKLAWVEREGDRWNVVLASPDGARLRTIAAPPGAMIGDIVWSGRDLLASVGAGGFIELARLEIEQGTWTDLTRTTGAAFSPAPAADFIYFLALDSEGMDVRRLEPTATGSAIGERVSDVRFAPAVRAPFDRPVPPPLEVRALPPPVEYRSGPRMIASMFGGYNTSHSDLLEAGMRTADPIGRLDAMLAGGWSEEGERGALLDLMWRGFTSNVGGSAWHWRQSERAPDAMGASVRVTDDWRARGRALSASLTAGWERLDGEAAVRDGFAALIDTGGAVRRELASTIIEGRYGASLLESESEDSTRMRGALSLSLTRGDFGIGYRESAGEADQREAFRIGGLTSSILPPFQRSAIVEVPALAAARVATDEFRDQRASVRLPIIPGELFAQRITTSHETGSERIELGGWSYRLTIARIPIIGIPELELELGGAYEFDAPLDEDVTWWIGTRWAID